MISQRQWKTDFSTVFEVGARLIHLLEFVPAMWNFMVSLDQVGFSQKCPLILNSFRGLLDVQGYFKVYNKLLCS